MTTAGVVRVRSARSARRVSGIASATMRGDQTIRPVERLIPLWTRTRNAHPFGSAYLESAARDDDAERPLLHSRLGIDSRKAAGMQHRKMVVVLWTTAFAFSTWLCSCGGDNTGGAGAGDDASSNGGDGTVGGGPDGTFSNGDGTTPPNDGSGIGDSPSSEAETGTDAASVPADSVLMHHKNPNRDGLYVDPAFTKTKAAALTRDKAFDGTISGGVLGQPLFVANIASGKDAVFIATENNNVYSLDGATGTQNWTKNLGPTIPLGKLQCGSGINPYGVTGTGIIDLSKRTIYYESFTTPDNGATFVHQVFALSIDDGSIKSGWPVKIDAANVPNFNPSLQHDRGALALVNDILYVPFTGLNGDCGNYHGWIVGIDTTNPATIKSWATPASKGGAWGTSGIPSDGANVYLTTGNTTGTNGAWGGGEAVVRFSSGPVFSKSANDYFAPSNWLSLDNGDTDLGSSEAIVIDVPGATPASLLFAAGKEGKAFLIDRGTSMGGISNGVASLGVSGGEVKTAFAAYSTAKSFYVALHADGNGSGCPVVAGDLIALKVSATSPPKLATGWCADAHGEGSPMVTTTDGQSNAIVWVAGTSDNKLHGYDGDTGAPVYTGGGASETMQNLRHWITPTEAKGRIFVAGDNKVYAFQ
jgi:outer membrane protein assembly factor BamB